MHVPDTVSSRSEVRQFLVALAGVAFVLSTLGTRDGGPMAFAADIVLVLCGGWCANQLIRGIPIFKEQAICVLQAYFVGLLCCSTVLFLVGWLVFLPSEYLHLGRSLLFAATFTTNFELALLPQDALLRFDGLLDHLWVPALIAQCCGLLVVLCWLFRKNTQRLLLTLGVLAVASLIASTSESPFVELLPIGGLWAFLCGATPFFASNRYRILRYSLLLGIINLLTGILAVTATGDTLFARVFFALAIAFLYLGSRPRASRAGDTQRRRRWFGMALHLFLWAVPLAQLTAALDIMDPSGPAFTALLIPCLLLALLSWSVWQKVEHSMKLDRITPTAVIAGILFANGIISLSAQGMQLRYSERASAYIHALDQTRHTELCPIREDGPLAGLRVCQAGPKGPPTVLVWGDHQLLAMKSGFAEAARRAGVSTLLIAQPNCVPLDGLQTRFATAGKVSGRSCDQHSAQVLQALPHLSSIRQVTLVADWLYYLGDTQAEFQPRPPLRLGPVDGTPFNISRQSEYVETAVRHTVQSLVDTGLRVSVLRQVPALPRFNAEIAARSSAPGQWLYHSMPSLADFVPVNQAQERHTQVDDMFRILSAKGRLTYVDSWPAFCTASRCDARGGLSSDYASSTLLTPSGALSLSGILTKDLKRAQTHVAIRRDTLN
ncbi:SGNH hydrolase domain-containing protein [Marivita sp. S0852]|uniref:SGNH hydrolase domain-containing protein n=1 Tax=Marivita sp. S0852 TaxID=3373893 RepID=UPI003982C2C7